MKTDKEKQEYSRNYYLKNREKCLEYARKRYVRRTGKCRICGKDLSDKPHGCFRYCDVCMNDKTKISRQAIWYRTHKLKTQKRLDKTQ